MPFNSARTVAEIVRTDYRTADVFKKHGINYCCSGKVALGEACRMANLDYQQIEGELRAATRTVRLASHVLFNEWKVDFLVDYIINVHHAYLNHVLPALETQLILFADTHRKKHPELDRLTALFSRLSAALLKHIRYEEEVIFPYIKQIETAHRKKAPYANLFVRTLRKPLNNIHKEDSDINLLLQELAQRADNYHVPENACTNHGVIFQKLREFHDDMVQHQYLENSILFPKAIQIEQQLLQV